MIRAATLIAAFGGVVAISGAGCVKKKRDTTGEAIAKMREFTRLMCACKAGDKACAEKVEDEMSKWAAEMAKTSSAKQEPLSDAVAKEMAAITEELSKCTMTAMGGVADPAPGGVPLQIDAQIKEARARAAKHPKKLVMSSLDISYARADGMLDPQYGKLEVAFRVPPAPRADDPKRPIGAPVPSRPTDEHAMDCPTWILEEGTWTNRESFCIATGQLAPARCPIKQVWARAIKDEAPAAALASLSLHEGAEGSPQEWHFKISDAPRNIDIQKTYPDDCEPVVEKP